MGAIITLNANGREKPKEPHIHLEMSRDQKRIIVSLEGNPEELCKILYDAMEGREEIAKVVLTVVFQFMANKGITHSQLIKHTFFNDGK